MEPAWSRVKDAQKWKWRIVSKVESNSGGRDFWGESSTPTTSGWQLRRTLSRRGCSRQHTENRCELWDPIHVHEFWLNPEHALLGREAQSQVQAKLMPKRTQRPTIQGQATNSTKLSTAWFEYWIGQKGYSGFSLCCYGKIQTNFWPTRYINIHKYIHKYT